MPKGTRQYLVIYKFNLSGGFRCLSDLRTDVGSLSEDGVVGAGGAAATSSRSPSGNDAVSLNISFSPGSERSKLAAGISCGTPPWMSNGSA